MKVVSLVEGVKVTVGGARTVVVTRILRRRQFRAAKTWNTADADHVRPGRSAKHEVAREPVREVGD